MKKEDGRMEKEDEEWRFDGVWTMEVNLLGRLNRITLIKKLCPGKQYL